MNEANPYLTGYNNCNREIEISKFELDAASDKPFYMQLARQLQNAIEQGHHNPQKPLPSTLQLQRALEISGNTAFQAYLHLTRKGLVAWIKGEGFYLASKKRGEKYQ